MLQPFQNKTSRDQLDISRYESFLCDPYRTASKVLACMWRRRPYALRIFYAGASFSRSPFSLGFSSIGARYFDHNTRYRRRKISKLIAAKHHTVNSKFTGSCLGVRPMRFTHMVDASCSSKQP